MNTKKVTPFPKGSSKPKVITISIELYEQLLRTADCADAYCHGLVDGVSLADSVKMTQKAVGGFRGQNIEDELEKWGTRHPHIVKVWTEEHERIQKALTKQEP